MTDSHNPSVAEGKNSQTVTAERNSNVQIRNAAVAFDNESAAAHKHYTTSLTREEWEVIVTELDHLLLAPYSVVNRGRQQNGFVLLAYFGTYNFYHKPVVFDYPLKGSWLENFIITD